MKINASSFFKKVLLSLFILPVFSSFVHSESRVSLSEFAELGATFSRPILLANKLAKYKNLSLTDLDSIKQVNNASFYYSLSRLISESLAFYNRPGQNLRYLLPVLCIDAVESFAHFFSEQTSDETVLNIAGKNHMLVIGIDVLESFLASLQILDKTHRLQKTERVFKRGLYGLSLLLRYSNELYLNSASGHKVKLYATALSLLSLGLYNDIMEFKYEIKNDKETKIRQREREELARWERDNLTRQAAQEREQRRVERESLHREWARSREERHQRREELARQEAQEAQEAQEDEQNRVERERLQREQARESEEMQREYEEFIRNLREMQRQREEQARQAAQERAQRRADRARQAAQSENLNARRTSSWDNPESQEYIRNSRRAEAVNNSVTTWEQARERIRTGESVRDVPGIFLYRVMDIPETSSWDDIRGRYRVLARKNHPDRNPDNADESRRAWDTVSNAYNELKRRINNS